MHDLTLVGLDKSFAEGASVPVPAGNAALSSDFYEPLLAALSERSLDIAGIREFGSLELRDAIAAFSILVAGAYAAPMVTDPMNQPSYDGARRLNRVLIDENAMGGAHECLIAPATGAAVTSEYVEMLAIGLLWDDEATTVDILIEDVLATLDRQGRQLREDWVVVSDPVEARRIARGRIEAAIVRRTGIFSVLGIA